MTQAFNLSQFANNLNTSGATSNAGLQNSAVTVTAGTGMSGGGSVALGSSVTLTNAGVTSVVAGTGIAVSGATGAVTISASGGPSGTVTSVATGNGLSGGTITSTGTLIIACPSFNTVGSYCYGGFPSLSGLYSGTNYAAGGGNSNFQSGAADVSGPYILYTNNLSGSWKWMGGNQGGTGAWSGIACRVS